MFSDEVQFDWHWLEMLADTAAAPLGGRKIGDAKKLIRQMGLTLVFDETPQHRAEPDARRLALAVAQAITPIRS